MISQLSKLYGFEYYHFIQPNQYLKNSKPLSEEELVIFGKGGSPLIEKWYPALKSKVEKLKRSGVNIYDATMIFEGEPRTLYTDTCCHFNSLGNEILSNFIYSSIVNHLKIDGGEKK